MTAAIENVRGIKTAINMTGIAIAISPQSRSRSGAKKLAATKTSAGAVAKDASLHHIDLRVAGDV